jgi:hypothetical protein
MRYNANIMPYVRIIYANLYDYVTAICLATSGSDPSTTTTNRQPMYGSVPNLCLLTADTSANHRPTVTLRLFKASDRSKQRLIHFVVFIHQTAFRPRIHLAFTVAPVESKVLTRKQV